MGALVEARRAAGAGRVAELQVGVGCPAGPGEEPWAARGQGGGLWLACAVGAADGVAGSRELVPLRGSAAPVLMSGVGGPASVGGGGDGVHMSHGRSYDAGTSPECVGQPMDWQRAQPGSAGGLMVGAGTLVELVVQCVHVW